MCGVSVTAGGRGSYVQMVHFVFSLDSRDHYTGVSISVLSGIDRFDSSLKQMETSSQLA